MKEIKTLKNISNKIRREILKMNTRSKASHTGSAFSIVEILVFLYFLKMYINPKDPNLINRDKFILSKGHASSALYATMAVRGYFSLKKLKYFYLKDNGKLPGHLDKDSLNGIEISSGSLGHGLSVGVGMALADRFDNLNNQIYVLCGDGELNEGALWEAILFAPHYNLNNLTLIIDYNKLQGFGYTNDILNLEPLKDKFVAFNWQVLEINGHDFIQLKDAFDCDSLDRPKVIIAHTIKGKGVDFMENKLEWHYKSPNSIEFKNALKQLM